MPPTRVSGSKSGVAMQIDFNDPSRSTMIQGLVLYWPIVSRNGVIPTCGCNLGYHGTSWIVFHDSLGAYISTFASCTLTCCGFESFSDGGDRVPGKATRQKITGYELECRRRRFAGDR